MTNFKMILSDFSKPHLAGWGAVNQELDKMQNLTATTSLVSFTWQTFCSHRRKEVDMSILTTEPWIGIEHLTKYIPNYYNTSLNGWCSTTDQTLTTLKNLDIIKTCKGMLFATEYQMRAIGNKFLDENIKTGVVMHPIITDLRVKLFDFNSYRNNSNKLLINLGSYLRNFAIFEKLPITSHKKLFVFGGKTQNGHETYHYNLFKSDMIYNEVSDVRTEISPALSYEELNDLLYNNIIFINLYDASANNSILDAIERNTPIIVNRIPPCEEYLGEHYPLFYDHPEECVSLLTEENLLKAHVYLTHMNKSKFSLSRFISSINNFI